MRLSVGGHGGGAFCGRDGKIRFIFSCGKERERGREGGGLGVQ